jgi:pyrroline-5-carboxylate reductase
MNLGFIGVGKITSAIVEGLCTSGLEDAAVFLSPRNEKNSLYLADKYPKVHRLESNQEVLDRCEVLFVALPPAIAREMLVAIQFDRRHIVISLIPSLNYSDLAAAVGPATTVSRAIPLPTVMQHNCPIPIYRGNDTVTRLFSYTGRPIMECQKRSPMRISPICSSPYFLWHNIPTPSISGSWHNMRLLRMG